jgi:NAD(P)H-hydrate epimerase
MKANSSHLFPQVVFPQDQALELEDFKRMDYYAVENYLLPIELMMENAGLQLANLISAFVPQSARIKIGVGNGNNGGGGLVAARRLKAWNYQVFLDIPTPITRELPLRQLDRALAFGVELGGPQKTEVWVDAYLGFSQRLPLSPLILERVEASKIFPGLKVSLDIPTGFLGDQTLPYFAADKVLSLAAAKRILYQLPEDTALYVADLGIPAAVYHKFNTEILDFNQHNIIQLTR